MNPYSHEKIEKKWRNNWSKSKIYKTDNKAGSKDKFYILDMFPYPSGEGLHVGHPKGYIATDVYSRFMRMKGFNVLHPMGFDAFGLPAENYAIKNKTNPAVAVEKNVARYKEQLEILGFDYDWTREVNTTDPKYYKWTQWIFLKLFENGLAYESFEPINWCPSCKTGLANEDVEDGKCERCGSVVEKKPMRQWVLRITDYADKLLEGIDAKEKDGKPLLNWPHSIKELQKNWIGKSEGAEIDFQIQDREEKIKVFTTRPDTIFGVTYIVIAPEHPLVKILKEKANNKSEIEKYVEEASKKTEIDRTDAKKEKTGVELKGFKAINPANNQEVPIWIADYVLADYGTGAVMAVPAHDTRDWDFAIKYNLKIVDVIAPHFVDETENSKVRAGIEIRHRVLAIGIVKHPSEDRYLMLDWKNGWTGFVTGGIEGKENFEETIKREITEETGYKNIKFIKYLGGPNISDFFAPHKNQNQHVEGHGMYLELLDEERNEIDASEIAKHVPVWKSKDEVMDFLLKGKPMGDSRYCELYWNRLQSGNYSWTEPGLLINSGKFNGRESTGVMKEITEFVGGKWVSKFKLKNWVFSRQRYWGEPIPIIHCEKCGPIAVPEKDLPVKLPKVKSYEPTGTGESPLASITKWVNTKCPKCRGKGKRETNTMPQWAGSSWYYLRYMDPKNSKEFVNKKIEKYWSPVDLYVGGAEHATRHLIYARFWHRFLYDLGYVSTKEPFKKLQHVGLIMAEDGRKMSKRWNNVVNPDDMVAKYGADTLRVYEMFMGPFDQAIAWNTSSMIGARRFIERVWRALSKERITPHKNNVKSSEIPAYIHKAIKKVGEDITEMKYNTAISTLMVTINEIEKENTVSKEVAEIFLKLISPFAPHLAEEIWHVLGNKKSIHISEWPKYEESKTVDEEIMISIQIDGKVRETIMVSKKDTADTLKTRVLELENVKRWLVAKEIVKFIYIPNRAISIVTK